MKFDNYNRIRNLNYGVKKQKNFFTARGRKSNVRGGGSVRARNQKLLNFKNPEKVVSIDLKLSQTFFNNIRKKR